MVLDMRDIGKMIYSTAMELKFGQMALNMKVIIKRVKKMDKVLTFGVMDLLILENGKIIR